LYETDHVWYLIHRRLLCMTRGLDRILIASQYTYRHHGMINRYGISVSQMTTDMFRLS